MSTIPPLPREAFVGCPESLYRLRRVLHVHRCRVDRGCYPDLSAADRRWSRDVAHVLAGIWRECERPDRRLDERPLADGFEAARMAMADEYPDIAAYLGHVQTWVLDGPGDRADRPPITAPPT